MTTAVQRRRGTATEHSSFTGLEGELSVNTTNESVHVHDGSTAGGFELMRADGSNSSVTLGDISGVTAGTGLSGGGTSGTVTLDIDSTVTTLDGTQTLTNKTLTSPTLNTPTIGTSFTIGGATITEAELEILDGATVTTTELNYVDGVTSSIQIQIDAKAALASPTFTGTVTMDGLTVDTNTLYVDSTNNRVGVGTTSPNANLDIESSNATLHLTDSDDSTYAEVRNNGGTLTIGSDVGASAGGSSINFKVDNTERMRIDSSGNVGIGTSSPDTKLHVEGNILCDAYNNGGAGNGLFFREGFLTTAQPSITLVDHSGSAPDGLSINAYDGISFRTQDSERMRIDSSGNMGIGMTPSARLSIRPSGSGSEDSHFGFGANRDTYISTSSTGTIIFRNGSERMRIDSSGNLLVGTTATTPTTGGIALYKDSTRGIVRAGTSITSADAVAAWYNPNGKVGQIVTSGSSTSYNTSSDQRLKENIADADDAGSKIDAIQVRKFDWKADGSHQDYGMIAQELVEVAPEAVTVPTDSEEMMGVDYSKLVPMLIKEIQSLRNRVAQLEE